MSFALWEFRIPALVQLLTVLACTPSRVAISVLVSRPWARSRSAWQVVAATCFEHDAGGEGFAFAGAVTGGVEHVGGLGVGARVEEPVERGEGVGVGLADLPRLGWDRDGEARCASHSRFLRTWRGQS